MVTRPQPCSDFRTISRPGSTGTLLDRLLALRSNLIISHDLKPATLAVVLQAVALLLVFAANWVWLAMSQWHVPNEIYLVAFLFSLSLYWTTFRTQVPFFPSRPVAWQHVAGLLPAGKPVHLIDIGSGIGDMVMHVASHSGKGEGVKNSSFTGIEIAALPWLVSYIRGRLRRSRHRPQDGAGPGSGQSPSLYVWHIGAVAIH